MKILNIKYNDRIRIPACAPFMHGSRLLITWMLVIIICMTACQKFVSVKKTSSQSYMTTANDCQQLLDNYSNMNTGYPADGEISADDYYVIGESLKSGVNPPVSQEEKDLYAWKPDARRKLASPNWLGPYYVTYNANLVLETLDKLDPAKEDPAILNTLKGSALFYRGYALWFVAQLYAKPYDAATAAQDPGVPIRVKSDINEKSVRGTVKGTYDHIIKDLSDAVNLLPVTSSVATRPNKVAAYAMLARVYLSMEDYTNALANATAAINLKSSLVDYNGISTLSNSPFIRYNAEVIFHSISYYQVSNGLAGQVLYPGAAPNNIAKINLSLVNSYNSNDLRRAIFFKANSGVHAGSFRFTGNYEQTFNFIPTFFNGLAVDELLLTRAECYARAGKLTEALTDLNTLLGKRWKTGTYTDLLVTDPATDTQDEVLTKVLEERRKELVMRGLRWTDLRRLNKDPRFKKDLTRTITLAGVVTETYTLPANDPRYTLLLPEEVTTTTDLTQNQR